MSIRHLCIALLLAAPLATLAQTVWRCGADGRSYSDAPCPGGRAIEVADTRSAADVEQAREVVARDRALARQLVAERREREREWATRGSGLAGIAPADRVKLRLTEPVPQRPKAKPKRRPAAGEGTSRTAARASPRAPG